MRALMRLQVGTFGVHLVAPRCVASVDFPVFGRPTFARLATTVPPAKVGRQPRGQGKIGPLGFDPVVGGTGAVMSSFQEGSTGGHRCRCNAGRRRRRLQQPVEGGGRRGRFAQRVAFGQAGCETGYRCRQRMRRYQLGT